MLRRLSMSMVVTLSGALAFGPGLSQAELPPGLEGGHPEWVENFVLQTTTHKGIQALGPLRFSAPSLEAEIECSVQFFGAQWNEGSPTIGHGQVLGWAGQGDATANGTSPTRECKFKKSAATGEAWITDELPLVQTGTVGERAEPLTVPWNMELRCGERAVEAIPILRTGAPTGAAPFVGCRTEAEELAVAEKEETGDAGCYAASVPPGCVKITIVQPALGVEALFVGTLRPAVLNGFGNGLNATTLKYEGATSGRLRMSSSPAATLTVTGAQRLAGYGSYELLQVR